MMLTSENKIINSKNRHLGNSARSGRQVNLQVHFGNQILDDHIPLGNQARQRFAQSCPMNLPTPSSCPFGGICHSCPLPIQAKLKVSQPSDEYEREADRVADQVVRMTHIVPSTQFSFRHSTPALRGQCNCSGYDNEFRPNIFGKDISGTGKDIIFYPASEAWTTKPETSRIANPAIGPLKGAGQHLSYDQCNLFSKLLGYDFSDVRIHVDAKAAEASEYMGARAYTTGQDVVFGSGQYAPETDSGRWLVVHELCHVVQQSHGSRPSEVLQRKEGDGDVSVYDDVEGCLKWINKEEEACKRKASTCAMFPWIAGFVGAAVGSAWGAPGALGGGFLGGAVGFGMKNQCEEVVFKNCERKHDVAEEDCRKTYGEKKKGGENERVPVNVEDLPIAPINIEDLPIVK